MHPTDIVINDYVDGALPPHDAAEVERHLAACHACRTLVDDLREIARTATKLEPRDPPARAWMRIERAIKLENEERPRTPATAWRGRAKWAWLAAAAVLVLGTVVGLKLGPRGAVPAARPGATTPPAASSEAAQGVEAELQAAEHHYVEAINRLEQIRKNEQGALDPNTAATLQKNFAVIDQAISESRAALRNEPSSVPAQQSLIDNFKTKIELLQDTVALINEMRKGNEAGAGRIVSGLKQKGD